MIGGRSEDIFDNPDGSLAGSLIFLQDDFDTHTGSNAVALLSIHDAFSLLEGFTTERGSAAGTFDRPTAFSQLFEHHIPVITLDFNHTVAHGAPSAAPCFELAPEFFEFHIIKRNAGNHCYPFPLASFRCSSNSHDAIALRDCFFSTTRAFRDRLAASGTHPAVLSRVNSTLAHFFLSSMKARNSSPSYQEIRIIPIVNAYPFAIQHFSREWSFICFILTETLVRLRWMSNK
jgi:hypothetical protein